MADSAIPIIDRAAAMVERRWKQLERLERSGEKGDPDKWASVMSLLERLIAARYPASTNANSTAKSDLP